ncbi:SLAP domain-containing protein [Lactobacillus pasteurii]|nr:SLAP domain-containing protein [Lactobacillus pasteurii]
MIRVLDIITRYNKYTPIKCLPSIVKIKDKTYYKLADNNHYVKIINIAGKKRTLRHKAYAYNSKAEKNFLKKFAEGEDLITYGSQVTLKDGKKYYQIGKESYVRASNFVR